MKNLIQSISFLSLLLLVSCSGIDKDVVTKMQADLDTFSSNVPDFGTSLTALTNVSTALSTAPDALKNDAEYGPQFSEISEKISSIGMRMSAMQSQYDDLSGKLKTLIADYSSGKLKTDTAKSEYSTIKDGLTEITEGFKKDSERLTEYSTDYSKMMANWRAKVEAK